MSMTGLNRITDRILAEAQAEADRILAEAEADALRIRADYESRAQSIRDTVSAETEKEAKERIARARSSAATQKRNIMLQRKSDLVDSVFADTLANVCALQGEKYTNLLIGLLTACFLEQLESEKTSRALYGEEEGDEPEAYEVLLNQRDRDRCGGPLIEGVRKKIMGKIPEEKLSRLTVSRSTVAIDGGFILRCGAMEANCSLSLLFEQLRADLETEVGQALFSPPKKN